MAGVDAASGESKASPPVHFPELGAHHCRWPIDLPEPVRGMSWAFCGCPRVEGSSYCAAHRRQAAAPRTLRSDAGSIGNPHVVGRANADTRRLAAIEEFTAG